MEFGIFDFLRLVGALGFFIYGMKVMSEGIQRVAGEGLRRLLGAMTSNRFFGILTGVLITILVQSSSATTVMTVSFVNAGLLSLTQSIGVIMGANIGTTVTGWLISIFGFKFQISAITLPIIAIGFPMLFSSRRNLKSWAEVLIGFALLFMGLDELKNSMPDLKSNPLVLNFLANYTDYGAVSLLLFIFIGTVLTIIVQSSSAAMAITLVLVNQDVIPFEMAAGILLGENIGTTVTANLAAIVGNVWAKRSARAHFIFNVFGVFWMLLAFPVFISVIEKAQPFLRELFSDDNPAEVSLAIFHTTFNLINVLLLAWFVPTIEKVVIKMVKAKPGEDELFHLEYIGSGMMGTPELSLLEAKKEVVKFGSLIRKMLSVSRKVLYEKDPKQIKKFVDKIENYENITDRIEVEIADYLLKVSEGELSSLGSLRVRGMLSIVTDMERIGDLFLQIGKNFERKQKAKAWFTPEQRQNLSEMFELVDEAFEIMLENLNHKISELDLQKANTVELKINKLRNQLRKSHLKSMEKGDYNMQSGFIYNDIFSACEKIGDHIYDINEALRENPTTVQ